MAHEPITNTQDINEGFLSAKAAAAFLGIEHSTLAVWRCTKRHIIPFHMIGQGRGSRIFYRKSDLIAFMGGNDASTDRG